jgi:hypothetical protein
MRVTAGASGLAVVLLAALLTVACGGHGATTPSAPASLSTATEPAPGNTAVAEILAAPVPEGVDPALWGKLTHELAGELRTCASPNPENPTVNWYPRSHGITFVVSYMHCDYSGNGVVDIADLVPIAMYFGEDRLEGDHWYYDYNHSGCIDIGDISVIAREYGYSCSGFNVEFSQVSGEAGFARMGTIDYRDNDSFFGWPDSRSYLIPCDTRMPGPLWVRLSILDKSSRAFCRVVNEVSLLGTYWEAKPEAFTIYQTSAASPTISWSTMSLGMADGNQDGVSNYFDMGASIELMNAYVGDRREYTVLDYDRDGWASMADISRVAISFWWSIGRFQVEVSTEFAEEGFLPNGSVDFFASRGFNEFGFRWYEYRIASPPEGVPYWVRVVPYSFEDLPGTPSNALYFPAE